MRVRKEGQRTPRSLGLQLPDGLRSEVNTFSTEFTWSEMERTDKHRRGRTSGSSMKTMLDFRTDAAALGAMDGAGDEARKIEGGFAEGIPMRALDVCRKAKVSTVRSGLPGVVF